LLLLDNDQIAALLPIDRCVDRMRAAYLSWAGSRAISRPRSDVYCAADPATAVYVFKTMEGALPDSGVVALRLNSDVIRWERRGDSVVKSKVPAARGQYVGLVLLFSTETGEPLAIFPDGVMQRLRVAATSAVAANLLARADAAILGLLGSGWQAGAHAPAMCAVRPIREVRVFSPTRANREAFARTASAEIGVPVSAVDTPEVAARGADILVCATNAIRPIVVADWLRPGMHVTCVKESELGAATIGRADRVVVHNRRSGPDNYVMGLGERPIEAHDPLELIREGQAAVPNRPAWLDAPELKDVVAGSAPGRGSPDEITCFVNNMGIGLQFAALGAEAYAEARRRGIGRELPTEWFLESVHP
jgi:ornithine cyclodeaminase/alanine dehydrogenase-like protein (mu-crystallin family)